MVKVKNKDILSKYVHIYYDDLGKTKEFLESMALKGWMLTSLYRSKMTFQRCEPCKLNYAVEIFDKSSALDTFSDEEHMEYIEYCERAGWKFICESRNIQFFYSENLDLTPIETDDKMKLNVICKSMISDKIWGYINILFVAVFNFKRIFTGNPYEELLSFTSFNNVIILVMFILSIIVQNSTMLIWKNKCLKSIKMGKGIIERKHIIRNHAYVFLALIFGILSLLGITEWIKYGRIMDGQIMDAGFFIMYLIVLYIFMIIDAVKGQMVKIETKASIKFAIQVIIPFVIIIIFFWAYFINTNSDTHNTREYIANDKNIEKEIQYLDRIPLTFSDLGINSNTDEPGAGYSAYHSNEGSFLLKLDYYYQDPIEGSKNKNYMNYYLYQSKSQVILNQLLNDIKKGKLINYGVSFNFDKAKQQEYSWGMVYMDQDYLYRYLFTFDNAIVFLNINFEMNEAQIQSAKDKLVDELVVK